MLLRPPVRDGGFRVDNHTQRPPYATDDSPGKGSNGAMHTAYRRTHSRDSPSDRHGTLPSDSLRQMACYGPQEASPESAAQSAPIPSETREPPQCLRGTVHEP